MCFTAVAAVAAATTAGVWPAPIVGGNETTAYPAVVALVDDRGEPYCTGALVEDTLVLTAAHCVLQGGVEVKPAAVFFGSRTAEPGERIAIDAMWVAPSYQPGVLVADVALLRLVAAPAVAPLPWPAGEPGDLLGHPIHLVGFGLDLGGEPGIKREVAAAVISDDGEAIRYDDGSCYGDSGGPVLAAGGDHLVAVISSGHPDCSGGRAVRLDPLRDELRSGAAALAGDDGGCRTAPASPPLAALAALTLLVVRRRSRRLRASRPEPATHDTENRP